MNKPPAGAHLASDPPPAAARVPREINMARLSRQIVLGDFAASMAHEVRQPLTAIIANAETCLRLVRSEAIDVDAVAAALTDIVDAGHRANKLIRRNGEMRRDQPVATTALDVNDLIDDVASLIRARLQAHGIRLTLTPGELPQVDGNQRELQHVLLNLIANAIEAMDAGEQSARALEIETSVTPQGLIRVAVADTGVGLNGEDLDRIFMPFHTTRGSALGMGLPISRLIIERHGGKLWAEPREGRGARFCFTLPTAAGDAAAV
jgi:signal transduction histidine kinase